MHRFGEVQAHRTSSNLLELHPNRDIKVYRVLLHEFGVVRLDIGIGTLHTLLPW